MATPQPAYKANAYAILCRALEDLAFRSAFLPELTEPGRRALEEAGITAPAECDDLLQILNLAVLGEQRRLEIGNLSQQQQARATTAANAYAIICRAMTDTAVAEALWPNLTDNGKRTLEEAGLSAPERDELLRIVNLAALGVQSQLEVTKAGNETTRETMQVVSAMKEGLKETMRQIDQAFNQTMWMYGVSFYMGVALIVTAIAAAFLGKQPLLPMVLGGLGTANTLTFFLTKPPERLQSSRASLAQLQCALLAWFNDFLNQNMLMQKLDLQGIKLGKDFDPAPFQVISGTIMKHTDDMLLMLQNYCKLIENPPEKVGAQTVAGESKPAKADAASAG